MKTLLQLQVQDGTSHADLREHIVRYDKATLKWTDAMCLASEPSHETVHIDVDRIEKGKKGKGKSKGMNNKGKQTKGDNKGDGKVKFQSSKGKGSHSQGGKQNPGFGQWNQTGYQQAGGKQSVQNQIAGKQSDKGKGRTCYTCGRTGHLARDCWNAKGKVAAVHTAKYAVWKEEMGTQEFQAPMMQWHRKTCNNFALQFHKMFVECNNRSCSTCVLQIYSLIR